MAVPDYGIISTPLVLYSPKDLMLARVLNVVVTGKLSSRTIILEIKFQS